MYVYIYMYIYIYLYLYYVYIYIYIIKYVYVYTDGGMATICIPCFDCGKRGLSNNYRKTNGILWENHDFPAVLE